jgi:Fe-S-cluster containining protein
MKPAQFIDVIDDYPDRERKEPALLVGGEMKLLVLKRGGGNQSFCRSSRSDADGGDTCSFYSPEGCKIYHYRPLLCRTYPFRGGIQNMRSRACPSEWVPEGSEKEAYGHDILLYEKELVEFQKFAEGWNSNDGGTLASLLAKMMKP